MAFLSWSCLQTEMLDKTLAVKNRLNTVMFFIRLVFVGDSRQSGKALAG